MHYDRSRNRRGTGFDTSPDSKLTPKSGECSEVDCSLSVSRRGLCSYHYNLTLRTPCVDCGELCTRGRARCKSCADNLTAPNGSPKTCTACKHTKPESDFGVRYDKARRVKVRSKCRECESNGRTHVKTTEIIRAYGTDCHICKLPIDMSAPRRVGIPGWQRGFQRDHVIPLTKGGPDTLENCRPSHGLCNLSKGNKQ